MALYCLSEKRECVFYKMIERESERKNASRANLCSVYPTFASGSPSSVDGLEAFFSLCNPLSGPLKFRSITAIQCYSTFDATISLLKTFHHPHPHHILAPPFPSGPPLRAPLSASSQVLPSTSSTSSAPARLTHSHMRTRHVNVYSVAKLHPLSCLTF